MPDMRFFSSLKPKSGSAGKGKEAEEALSKCPDEPVRLHITQMTLSS